MVLEGRVTVNGKVVNALGFKVDPLKDHIKVDGGRIVRFEPKITLLLNKPRGYLSTVKDPGGRPTVMDSCSILRQKEKNSWVQVVVTEGRNRLVKRMFSAIRHPVLKLKRIQFGPIQLGNLPFGQFRYLTAEEMERLKKLITNSRRQKAESRTQIAGGE
jgi:16S rRNA U516 pseudouridylate synthase RsuA-like enzyme